MLLFIHFTFSLFFVFDFYFLTFFSSQYIARQWITAIDMAINATKVKLYWKVDYQEVKFETGQNGIFFFFYLKKFIYLN